MTEVRAVLRQVGTQWILAVPDTVAEVAGWHDGQAVTVSDLVDDPELEQIAAEAKAAVQAATLAVDRALGGAQSVPAAGEPPLPLSQNDELAGRANDQLALVLSFFARVETKLSVVLAVDLAMISIAFAKVLPVTNASPSVIGLIALFAVMQVASLILLYRGSFPHLTDGERSLIYLRTGAALDEADYRQRFSERDRGAHTDDVIDQAWINARILTVKFDRLKHAYFWMGLSVAPWLVALAVLALSVPR